MVKTCPFCLVQFEPDKFHPYQIYCSVYHRKQAWKKRNWDYVLKDSRERARKKFYKPHIRKCKECKTWYKPLVFHPYQKYCSVKCRNKHNTKNHPEWKVRYREKNHGKIREHDNEYKARIRFGATSKTLNKRIVIERDKGLCQKCFRPYQVIHHIHYSGKPEDLVCLCRSCHASIHSL